MYEDFEEKFTKKKERLVTNARIIENRGGEPVFSRHVGIQLERWQ